MAYFNHARIRTATERHGRTPRSILRACVAVGGAAAAALAGSVGAAEGAGAAFSRAVTVSAPTNAAHNPNAWLQGVSCTGSGACASVGQYTDTLGHQQGMAATEAGGKWGRASEVAAPTNAYSNPTASFMTVSCPSAGNCDGVGYYTNTSRYQEAMTATEAGGKWGRAIELVLPNNASTHNPYAVLEGVSCASPGNCTGVGQYSNSSGSQVPMVATEASGKWGRAVALTLPSNAGSGSYAIASLFQVSCMAAASCTATGFYSDTSNSRHALVATETGGKWGRAVEFTLLPAGASGTWSSLYGVSCVSNGNCAAVGAYEDSSSASHAMAVTEAAGKWGKATELVLPSGADPSQPNAELEGVSCSSAGNCAGFGVYSNTGSYSLDMVATETGGKWARAAEVSAPAGSIGFNTISGGSGNGVACAKTGSCTAVGGYGVSSGAIYALAAAGTV